MKNQQRSNLPQVPRAAAEKVGPDDPRYADLVRRRFNKRFAGKTDYIRLPGSTEQVEEDAGDGDLWGKG